MIYLDDIRHDLSMKLTNNVYNFSKNEGTVTLPYSISASQASPLLNRRIRQLEILEQYKHDDPPIPLLVFQALNAIDKFHYI
jgi:hypothetical protein